MSHAGNYIKSGMSFLNKLEEGKPHTSVTDWIEVLSGDRYDELSLDGIPELVESVNIQGQMGTQEASRAIRKKLKYGNVHRQLRALVLLRALTENASKGFQLNWANEQMTARLKEMATDTLLDPKVKKRLMLVFHAWSIQYRDEPRMASVAKMYAQYSGQTVSGSRRGSLAPGQTYGNSPASPTSATSQRSRHAFGDIDTMYGHSWEPTGGSRGADTYSDLAAAKADAESRRAARDRQILLEQREAEMERKEREMKRKTDMAALEVRRMKDQEEEAERRRVMKENMKRGGGNSTQQKPKVKFDLQREKPNIMVSVATAIQAANNLVNSMRHLNREHENLFESPRVQDNLDKAKAARRTVIKYVQVVQDEELVGTLLEANEKVVEAIQMYDKLSKPAALDSDSDHEAQPKSSSQSQSQAQSNKEREMDALTRRMEAQRLEAMRTGELQKMQERQKRESAREQERRKAGRPTRYEQEQAYGGGGGYNRDLADLDFGGGGGGGENQQSDRRGGGDRGDRGGRGLPPPMSPDSERGSFARGSLSDFSDDNYDYDSSDEEYRRNTQSRRQSQAPANKGGSTSRRASQAQPQSPQQSSSNSRRAPPQQPQQQKYKNLMDDDPFADDDTPVQENRRMQWAEI